MRLMYDADNPYDIPSDAEMVAGYVDGSRTKWTQEMWDRFPNSVHVRISAVGATHLADVFDVEPGCIWPPERVISIILRAREAGIVPTVYCNELNHWHGIRKMFQDRQIQEPLYWVANYDKVAEVPNGAIAKQFKHPPQVGKHYDLSAVANYWPGVDIEVEEGDDMGYSYSQVELPPSDGNEYQEKDVTLPHLGGATKVRERYVTLYIPGMPFGVDENGQPTDERDEANIRYAHWKDIDGEIVGHYFGGDDTMLGDHETTSGHKAPDSAVKLTVQYDSPVGLNAGVEIVTGQ